MTNKSLKSCWVGGKSKKMCLELFFLCRFFFGDCSSAVMRDEWSY